MEREIGIVIRVKQAAKAKQEIKDIVDKQILEHLKQFNLGLQAAGTNLGNAGKKAKEAKGEFDSFFTNIAKGAGAFYALKRGIGSAFDSFEKGAGLERAAVQFENSVGRISEVMPELRAATRGTVEDLKIIQTANRAVMEGLPAKQLTAVYRMATVASRKLGMENEQAIQTITHAITRQDESALTTLGTIMKMNLGLKVQEALIAKNGGVMSGAIAVGIRQSVIMSELNKKFGGFNALQEDSVEIVERFRAVMSNLKSAVGSALGVALIPLLRTMTGLAETVTIFLKAASNNEGFKVFVQTLVVASGIFTAGKLLAGIKKSAMAMQFLVGNLKMFSMVGAGMLAFKMLGGDLNTLTGMLDKAALGVKVFFDLIGSFNSSTGMSQVLAKDKEGLGELYKFAFQAAKVWLVFKAAVVGVFEGVHKFVNFLAPMFGDFGKAIASVFDSLANETPLAKSALDAISYAAKTFGGVLASMTAGVVLAYGAIKSLTVINALYTAFSNISSIRSFLDIIKIATKAVWAQVAARTALLALSGPKGWAMIAGAAVATGAVAAYGVSRMAEAESPKQKTGADNANQDVVAARSQNIDFLTQGSPQVGALIKEMKLTREANERMDKREEIKESKESVQPSAFLHTHNKL